MKTSSVLLLVALVSGCTSDDPSALPGQLEWDRVGIVTDVSEPIVAIHVREGDQVDMLQPLVDLDARRSVAKLDGAVAFERQQQAALTELLNGARQETVDASRARLAESQATLSETRREEQRVAELRNRGLIAAASLDAAVSDVQRAKAEVLAAQAALRELTQGTRPEQIDQAQAALAAAAATRQELALSAERLELRAPVSGRVDAVLFELGDQPASGSTVVSLLVGSRPFARVYVPASQRAGLRVGAAFDIRIEGIAQPIEGRLKSIASEPSFTPYFALVGDDSSRLVYRAEIELLPESSTELPAGLPLSATRRNE